MTDAELQITRLEQFVINEVSYDFWRGQDLVDTVIRAVRGYAMQIAGLRRKHLAALAALSGGAEAKLLCDANGQFPGECPSCGKAGLVRGEQCTG